VSRPSSRICNNVLKISGAPFHLVEEHHRERLTTHASVSWPPRRNDVPGGERSAARPCAFHVLAHVELDQRVLIAEEELGERLANSVLPTPVARGK